MKKNRESEKVENLESYFHNHHYEDLLVTDMEQDNVPSQEEENLRVDSI